MTKPVYHVSTKGQPETFCVSNHLPDGAKAPRTEGCMIYIPGTGFEVTMRCYEENPKAVFTEPDQPVCRDSCMEAFMNFFPEEPEPRYVNVEMNSIGTVLCAFGFKRPNRTHVLKLGYPQPKVTVEKGQDADGAYWQTKCLITEEFVEKLYGKPCKFQPGDSFQANFYKCGDQTEHPHWASWSKVAIADFHTPEFFGIMKIV